MTRISNIADLRLGDLLSVLALANFGSFSSVARRHGVTHSQVTKALDRVELRLGVKLFHRSTRSLLPTPEAARVLEALRTCMAGIEGLVASEPATPALRLALASPIADLAWASVVTGEVSVREVEAGAFVLSPSAADFELALVDDRFGVADGWERFPVGNVEWSVWSPTPEPKGNVAVAVDGLPFFNAGVLAFPRLHHAAHFALRQAAALWAPEWAIEFYGLTGFHRLDQVHASQTLTLLCHPDLVSASLAKATARQWGSALCRPASFT